MLIHQIRYTLRTLRRAPGFTAMAIVTVALGVGANTAVFSVVDGVLLRPLPYAHPDRLVRVSEVPVALRRSAGRDNVAAASLQHYRLAQSFEGLAGYNRMSRSLAAVDLGFEAQDVLLFTVNPPDTRYRDEAARVALFEEIERRVASIPGVASAAVANEFPLRGGGQSPVTIAGEATTGGDNVRRAGFQAVSPGYFATLRISLLRGRLLAAQDRAGAPPAAVVSETFVRRFLAGRDPIGQRFRESRTGVDSPELIIVGVVRDARRDGPRADLIPLVYLAAAQPDTYSERTHLSEVAVRAAGTNPHALLPAIQQAVWSIDPSQPITSVLTLDEVIAGSTAERRFNMTLLSAVALLALGLAIVGVYGVVAHAAVQRTREIGIRIALGARRRHVLSLVIASGLRWAVLGVAAGLAGAYAGTRFLAAMLFGVTPTDPGTFAGLAALMLGVAALASYVPARRAASVDPMSALRAD